MWGVTIKMENKKTIGLMVVIAILVSVGYNEIPDLFDDNVPKYFCNTRPELGLKECDSFSKYVAELGKCIDDDGPNFICRSGWKLVIDDTFDEQNYIKPSSEKGDWKCYTPPKNKCEKIEVK